MIMRFVLRAAVLVAVRISECHWGRQPSRRKQITFYDWLGGQLPYVTAGAQHSGTPHGTVIVYIKCTSASSLIL